MEAATERDIRRYLVVLEDINGRCRNLLNQKRLQEADLRDALCMLKFAHSDAERGLVGIELEDWHKLRAITITTVAMLLGPLRGYNPDLNTWERARDATIPVQGRTTRSGTIRTFDYQRIRDVYAEIKKKAWEKLPGVRPDSVVVSSDARLDRGQAHTESETEGRSIRPPGPPVDKATSEPLGTQPNQCFPRNDGRWEWNPKPGPPGGRFPMASTEDDSGEPSDTFYRKGKYRKQKKDKKYGHQEDDLDFFRGAYQDEVSALQNLGLGDDFKYPSDEAFARYFPEFDFVKAMRGNSLRKWDGTIRDYPGFKHNYYRMIYVQREHYMHKILALEVMVPEHIKKELFHGLHYTVEDLGQRLQRLEDRFGGQEKQMKQIVNELQKLQTRGRVPYAELRAAVEDVSAYLERPSTLPGTGETLVVLLKKVIPKHFRTQYNEVMHLWNKPKTGNNFVDYMKRRLTYEIDESEDQEKKDGVAAKKADDTKIKKLEVKTNGKLYKAHGRMTEEGSSSESSPDEGECLVAGGNTREVPECRCCQEGRHFLHNCRKFFLVFSLKERASYVKQQQTCLKCLRTDHKLANCPFQNKPDCRFCGAKDHHYLLCPGPVEGTIKTTHGDEEGYGFENVGELIARKKFPPFN